MSPREFGLAFRAEVIEKLKWMIVGDGPEPRSFDDQRVLINWINAAIDGLSAEEGIETTLLRMLWSGEMTATVIEGNVRFRLTAKGHETATTALMDRPELRHWYQSLSKGAAVDEPKKPQ